MTEDQVDKPVTAREQDIQAVSRTAQILGLYRPTLYNKMRRHGISARDARRRGVTAMREA